MFSTNLVASSIILKTFEDYTYQTKFEGVLEESKLIAGIVSLYFKSQFLKLKIIKFSSLISSILIFVNNVFKLDSFIYPTIKVTSSGCSNNFKFSFSKYGVKTLI